MEYINVETTKGIQREIVYNVDDFPYYKYSEYDLLKKKNKYIYNIVSSFDIETTTIEPAKNGDGDYICEPYGFMYQWQFAIEDEVVFGRTWEEFQQFLKKLRDNLKLSDKQKLIVYVHNLAFEFQHMKEFIKIDSIFAKDTRKPMKIESEGIEFRCSYFLSNMSLKKFCENSQGCYHYKLSGDDYDYRKLRTPQTPLTEKEKGYCYNDVRGLNECIRAKLKDDTLATIPLTSTGYVRREYRTAMNTKQLRYNFVKAQLNVHDYLMLKRAFRGGNTHANMMYANIPVKNVHSFDISSSYPSSIEMDDFPVGKFTRARVKTQRKLDYLCENYCCVFDVIFYNIEVKKTTAIPYIDIAHCYKKENYINDNGRIIRADTICMTITNIDLDIIRETYLFDGFRITDCIYAEKGKLPKEMRKKMMEFFEGKTKLKAIEGKEYEYLKSKNMLNATYGMCVTDICHSEIHYNAETFEWSEHEPDIQGSLMDFYKSRNNFLWYQWGVFVTANARRRLQNMLNKVGLDVIYIDTDSIKFINEKHIQEFNEMNRQLVKQAETNDIPAYVDRVEKDGSINRFHLGTWDNDGNYKIFKTLGAKKYCFTKDKKGKEVFEITVSGMSKVKGSKAVGSVDNFVIGKTFSNIGRTTSWFNDCKKHKITVEGCTFTTASNIGVLETTYTLGVTNEYWDLIKGNGEYII